MLSFTARFLAAALLALAAAPATAQTPTTIRLSTNPIDSGAEVYYADALGLFAKAGLNVTIQPGANGAAIAASVAGNAVDIGYADIGALAKAHIKGVPFTIIAPAALWDANAPVNVVMVAKNSPLRSPKDLNGKTVAVPGLGTGSDFAVHQWIDVNGGDSTTVHFLELPYSAMPAAIEAGRIDAAQIAEPFVAVAKQHGRVLGAADDALGKMYLRTVWFASTPWANAHPDVLAKFAAVMRETAAWANDKRNQAKSAAILVERTKIDPALVASMTRARYGESLDAALVQPEIDLNAKYSHFPDFPAPELLGKH